ncbi:helix-turn-helix domain-containing protein, partial [Methylobacterium sp. CM6247]
RLGRDYADVTETIREMMHQGVIVKTVINSMVFDGATTDPMLKAVRDALIGFMAAMSQAQAEATREAQKAGIAHAKGRDDAYLGRKPSYDRSKLDTVIAMLNRGDTVQGIAKATGISRGTIYRIRNNRVEAEAALARWAA